ncbi:hypothetical protein PBRA_001491 [Plasmodiophora brassicae]|nr:hypothetical protein PBRA_001491 [Plasmodiophora brassicae]
MRHLIAEGRVEEHYELHERSAQLLTMRRDVCNASFAQADRERIRREIIELLESCRRCDEGHMCPRTAGHAVATVANTPIQELLSLHRDMYDTMQKESSSLWLQKAEERRQIMAAASAGKPNVTDSDEFEFESNLPRNTPFTFHLDVMACIFSVGESTQVFFSLYSPEQQRFVSEEYVVELTAAGMPEDINLLGNLKGEFRDVELSHFKEGLYLVCQIFRMGSLRFDGKPASTKKSKKSTCYRRPFGCAVLKLSSYAPLFEQLGQWCNPPHLVVYRAKEPLQFSDLHNMIIRGSSNFEIIPQTKGFALGLMLEPAKKPLSTGSRMQMLSLSSNIHPSDDRNDFYVTIRGGDFLQDKKKSAKNIEVRVQVLTGSGYIVPDCIFRGVGPTVKGVTEYCSTVNYHWNNPVFCETLNIRLQASMFSKCHILCTVWHVSTNVDNNQLCSFAFLPLTSSTGAVIADGTHTLPCYKPFKNLGQPSAGGASSALRYLDANAHFRSDDNRSRAHSVLMRRKEELVLETRLSSVKTTQLDALHALFNWRQLDAAQMQTVLTKFTMISGAELAKFVKETFDTLFAVLVSPVYNDDIIGQVFLALLFTIDQLTTKMSTVGASVDSYVSEVFHAPDACPILIARSRMALEYATVHSTAPNSTKFKQLTLMCKCFQHVLRFIVRSASQQPSKSSAVFKGHLQALLRDVTALLETQSGPKDPLIGCKAFVLRAFSSTFADLSEIFSPVELGEICLSALNAVPHSEDNAKLHMYKLRMIGSIVQSVVGRQCDSWSIIETTVIAALQFHLTSTPDESYLAVGIVGDLIQVIQSASEGGPGAADLSPFVVLLPALVNVASSAQARNGAAPVVSQQAQHTRSVDLVMESCAYLCIILHCIPDEDMSECFGSLENHDLIRLIQVCETALQHRVYPSMWIVLNTWELSIVGRVISAISAHSAALDLPTMQAFLHLCVVLETHKDLHGLTEAKRAFVDPAALPETTRTVIRKAWRTVQDLRCISHFFCTSLLIPLSRRAGPDPTDEEESCQSHLLAMDMYMDLVREEHARSDDLSELERYTIDALDVLANESQEEAQLFVSRLDSSLKERLRPEESSLAAKLKEFLQHLSTLADLMQSLLLLPKTEQYEHERASIVTRLLDFLLSDSNAGRRKTMLYRYYSYLIDLNASLGAFAEAGNTALLQAQLLDWSSVPLSNWDTVDGGVGIETEESQKEHLLLRVIDLYDRAELWERAIQACEQLRVHYEVNLFDYDKLAGILERQAALFRKIISQTRYFPSYFRVVFYSNRTDRQEFVYRGIKLESVMDFTQRIRAMHTNAKILMTSDDPPADVVDEHELVITITSLTLSSQAEMLGVDGSVSRVPAHIPEEVLKYRANDEVSVFVYCKTENRSGEARPSNEFKDLWVRKTFIRTKEPFPSTQRRLPVAETVQRVVHPIDTAVETIVKKNNELRSTALSLEKAAHREEFLDLGPLTMLLNGICDAAVNGGTKKYIEAFLDTTVPGKEASQSALKAALLAQIDELRFALNVFKTRKNADLDPLYNRLRGLFDKMVGSTNALLK